MPKTNTSQSYILSIRNPLEEFYRRVKGYEYNDLMIERMIARVWYCLLHRDMAPSALMDYGCRLRDMNHPFTHAVGSFGTLLQRELELFRFYEPAVFLNTYHFSHRHGKWAIVIKRGFEDHLNLMCP